jgi:hypothetical protein
MRNESTVKKEDFTNIIDCSNFFQERSTTEQFVYQFIEKVREEEREKAVNQADDIAQKKIKELELECMFKEKRLQNCIPTKLFFPLFIAMGITCIALTVTIMQILLNSKVVDYYILLFIMVGGIGLSHTSIAILKGWKRFICGEADN